MLPKFGRVGHAGHVNRCLSGLPASQVEADASRTAVGFYCVGALDLLGLLDSKTSTSDRENWKEWIWEQQTHGANGSGFRPGPFTTPDAPSAQAYDAYSGPHLVMTYTALLTLAILRDDFTELDRAGLVEFVRSCQKEDGSFSIVPGFGESDLRTIYCAISQAVEPMKVDTDRIRTAKPQAAPHISRSPPFTWRVPRPRSPLQNTQDRYTGSSRTSTRLEDSAEEPAKRQTRATASGAALVSVFSECNTSSTPSAMLNSSQVVSSSTAASPRFQAQIQTRTTPISLSLRSRSIRPTSKPTNLQHFYNLGISEDWTRCSTPQRRL
uniref:Geranylgeranyltransferase type 1 subunit beta n=1 Tax=Mycena chlorophos TaxID=658473 RepID=A0ABQ0L3H6_MYCCL|nr:geranylgeranyltransferase type 1 subunit beta [Mycena chlorophos]